MWSTASAIIYIFGGCCSNVLTLESLIDEQTNGAGDLLTFCQFSLATIEGLFNFLDWQSRIPRLKTRKVPLKVYALTVLLYYTSSVANNSVFQYGISVPLHIVFRCSGTVVTMIIGWLLAGKRYSRTQVFSALLLMLGAIITTLFKDTDFTFASLSARWLDNTQSGVDARFLLGVLLLVFSSVTSSTLSLYNEWTYRRYGKNWKESLFYTHALALPLFLVRSRELGREFLSIRMQKPSIIYLFDHPIHLKKVHLLLANVITQQICIRGVNLFACYTSALTLSVALLARKIISLILSVYIFGDRFSTTGYFGIIIVLSGTVLYTLGPSASNKSSRKKNK